MACLVLLHVWHSSDAVCNAESLVWLRFGFGIPRRIVNASD